MVLADAIQFLLQVADGKLDLDSGLVAMLEYILDVFKIAKNVIPDWVGNSFGIAGLIVSIAMDVMNALDDGSTTNALFADIIVDICLWGAGEGLSLLGAAIGTVVAPGVGSAIGKFVGAMVGSAGTIAMEHDWNGEKEGGCGKDALSERLLYEG